MQNILITGCSSGIGLQTALTLKENNYKVYASARKEEDVEMLRNLGFETFKIDVRNKEEITQALETIIKNDIKNDTEKDLMNTFVKCKLVEVCNDYDFIATLIEK